MAENLVLECFQVFLDLLDAFIRQPVVESVVEFWSGVEEMHHGIQVPHCMGEVVFRRVAEHEQLDVVHGVIHQPADLESLEVIVVAVLVRTLFHGGCELHHDDWAEKIVSKAFSICSSFCTGFMDSDVFSDDCSFQDLILQL